MNCEICGGTLNFLGTLGLLDWFRCRSCGMEASSLHRPNEVPDLDDMDGDDSYAWAYAS